MIVVVTGTGTGVGKTIVSAALCALQPGTAYLKVAQTGVPGDVPDIDVVAGLAPGTTVVEGARFPDPMSPEAAARASGLPEVSLEAVLAAARTLAATHDVVVVEGAGGLLVRYGAGGWGLAEVATALGAPVVVVAGTELGTLNALALTLEAVAHRGLQLAGVVIGAWPVSPTVLDRSNEVDLAALAGGSLAGRLPAGAGRLGSAAFGAVAREAVGAPLARLITA